MTDLKRKLGRLSSAGPGSQALVVVSGSVASVQPDVAAAPVSALADTRLSQFRARLRGALTGRRAVSMLRPDAELSVGSSGVAHVALISESQAAMPLPAVATPTAQGELFATESRFVAEHCHGHASVGRALDATAAALSQLCPGTLLPATLNPRAALYLDTETTGLAGGTGTLPFVIGMGYFDENDGFVVRQLVLRGPGCEVPLLYDLAQRMSVASCLVTYNGRSFDWPLLRTRFVLNRVPIPAEPPHIDLLHCARRLLRRRLARVPLQAIERDVFGYVRQGDIAGAEIPETYFRYLRTGNGELLRPVVEHNALDIVALAALMGELCHRITHPSSVSDARDRLSLAEHFVRLRQTDDAERLVDSLNLSTNSQSVEVGGTLLAALLLQATLLRRRKQFATCRDVLLKALATLRNDSRSDPGVLAEVHLRLSKLYEHKLGDAGAALSHATEAGHAEEEHAHAARVQRLMRKAGNSNEDTNAAPHAGRGIVMTSPKVT